MPTVPTLQLIRFILTHNYFSLGDAIYLQLMGSAMGSKMAPQYANLFMVQLEENFLASCNTRPLTYLWCSIGGRYIGETGQKLRTRMNHHRHKINTKSCDTPVGQHFCSQNHSLQDMHVLILKGNFKTERERKIYEFKCMELFNTLRQGLNLGSGFMSHYVT
ncbi:hypothetical protein XELAEV_18033904mg [Xenopus laevis]|uniref:GIY-YIG domain-containing protein n=1 Tax=Xenopus laevis TaxID=8355 RepID=A0A974CLP7_XENLA|nr:hypothetical protein XELAEV_18033904mg [Xenopus laevis]